MYVNQINYKGGALGALSLGALIWAVFGRPRHGCPNMGGFWPPQPRVPYLAGFWSPQPWVP